jgi:uncharacterized protein
MGGAVHQRAQMIREMAPERQPGRWVYCAAPAEIDAELLASALATVREPEGLSLVVRLEVVRARGLAPVEPVLADQPVLAHVLLRVHSALEGVGLTAAVAETLAGAGIACNVVAGLRHDHLLVPEARADEAVALLKARAARENEAAS